MPPPDDRVTSGDGSENERSPRNCGHADVAYPSRGDDSGWRRSTNSGVRSGWRSGSKAAISSATLHALPPVGHRPSPWTTWKLIGLVRHRRRQLWVGEVVATRLGGDQEAIATMGSLGHPPDIPQQGLVPGLTEWEYFFHGKGCCLTHRGTGEAIDVDFFGLTAEFFDGYFYLRYLRSMRDPGPPEARLISLHPSSDSIWLAVGELLDAGMLTPMEGRERHPFLVADEVLDHEREIDEFCEAWENPDRRPWLDAAIGDWLAAHEFALGSGDQGLIEGTAERASACKEIRRRELLACWDDEPKRGNVLLALDDLDDEVLRELLNQTLTGPIDGVTSRAVGIIERRDDPAWSPAIHGLFRRLDPKRAVPEAYLWSRCLLQHDHLAEEMKAALPRAEEIAIGEAALLAENSIPAGRCPCSGRLEVPHPGESLVGGGDPRPDRQALDPSRVDDRSPTRRRCRNAGRPCWSAKTRRPIKRSKSGNGPTRTSPNSVPGSASGRCRCEIAPRGSPSRWRTCMTG